MEFDYNISENTIPEILIRSLEEKDLAQADHIMRIAFGTYLGSPEPANFFGETDYVYTRFKANPKAAFCAEVNKNIAGSVFVYYWEGAASAPRGVRNLSVTGAEIVTPDRWYPGTIINLTLQSGGQAEGDGAATCKALSMRSKVVAHSRDGVRLEFLYLNQQEREAARGFLAALRMENGR